MTNQELSLLIDDTKGIVLTAIHQNLFKEYVSAIDDIVQETYFRAYKHLKEDKFENRSKLTSWLFVIARNETIRMNQKLSRNREKVINFSMEPVLNEELEPCEENEVDLKNYIQQLPEKYSDVIQLYVKGNKEEEIASYLNLKRGTVKSRINRAKKMLKKLFSDVNGAFIK